MQVMVTHVHVQDAEGKNIQLYQLEPIEYGDENFKLTPGTVLEVLAKDA